MPGSFDKDKFIARMLQADDRQAVTLLYRLYFKDAVNMAYGIVKDKTVAKDIAQELFLTIWEKRHQIDFSKSMRGYLMRSAYNQSLNYLRKQLRKKELRLADLDGGEAFLAVAGSQRDRELQELKIHIHNVIETLPPTCKTIFRLSRNEKLSNAQIAGRMNISVKAVEKQISKALKTLRKKLSPYLKSLLILLPGALI